MSAGSATQLQWGRRQASTESSTCGVACGMRYFCFNGAVDKRRRRDTGNSLTHGMEHALQWGRRQASTERLY